MGGLNVTTTIQAPKSKLKPCPRCLYWPCQCEKIGAGDKMSPARQERSQLTQEELEVVKRMKIALYARMIGTEAQFKKILLDANPASRRQVYDVIRPHLRFKVRPYFLLMGRD